MNRIIVRASGAARVRSQPNAWSNRKAPDRARLGKHAVQVVEWCLFSSMAYLSSWSSSHFRTRNMHALLAPERLWESNRTAASDSLSFHFVSYNMFAVDIRKIYWTNLTIYFSPSLLTTQTAEPASQPSLASFRKEIIFFSFFSWFFFNSVWLFHNKRLLFTID